MDRNKNVFSGQAYTLFQILSLDERAIVLSDVSTFTIYTWNKSSTLQAWERVDNRDAWREVALRTLGDAPRTFEAARVKAIAWMNE